ncbi:MAG: hypothetical protein WCT39_03775 [Candidatus Margulisiibacteriota bacterium]
MHNNSLKKYRQRFEAVANFEKNENRKMPLQEKLQRLCSVFYSSIGRKVGFGKDRKGLALNPNWLLLKT